MYAPSHYREAFSDAILAFLGWEGGQPEPKIVLGDRSTSLSQLIGLMWNCSDILSSGLLESVRELEDRHHTLGRATYGAAARLLKTRLTAI